MSLSDKSTYSVLPWIEKYRPVNFSGIISHDSIVEVLKKTIANNSLQHLLFHGPPGTGKTSMIMACARELYGTKMDLMVLNINASEERGIEVVRTHIQRFVSSKIINSENGKSVFKLVILDEADAMTSDAQAMLRKVIEKYSYCTRFCLICNYVKKITIALQSRCACYRFSPLKLPDIKKKIMQVVEAENLTITDKGIDVICKRSKGDMRKVLNILQSTSMSYEKITGQAVNNCIGYPDTPDIKKIFDSLISDPYDVAWELISKLKLDNSYSLQDIITEIAQMLIHFCTVPGKNTSGIESKVLLKIIKELGQIEYNLAGCTSELIQTNALLSAFSCNTYKETANKN